MFLDPSHERVFYDTMATYGEEFGADKVIVIFPKRWSKRLDPEAFKPMKLQTWELPAVGLRVHSVGRRCTAQFTMVVTT